MRPWHLFLGLPEVIIFVALFFLAVFLLGLVVGLALSAPVGRGHAR